jgi:hypothetical protein
MAKVNPPRIATPRIVQPGGAGRGWLWLLFLVALAAWSWQVFDFGRQRGGLDAAQRDRVEEGLRDTIQRLEEERDALRAAAARYERSGQIDRAAADGVKSEVRQLQEERAELRREIAFLKSLVSGGSERLLLDGHSLTDLGQRNFQFEVTLTKRADDPDTVTGQATISVVGQVDGAERRLDMETLTEGRRNQIGVRFKNFQKLKTEMLLPEGFEPSAVEVVVKPEGKKFKAFEQAFEWKVSDS